MGFNSRFKGLIQSSVVSKHTKITVYRSLMLLIILYGCETWSLTVREGHRLRVLENMVLRKHFDLLGRNQRMLDITA
jgi:hypothetical protein